MQKNCLEYPVEFTEDIFGSSSTLAQILMSLGGARVSIVADLNMINHTQGIGSRIGKYINEHGIELVGNPVVLSGGERIKSDGQSAMRVMNALLEAKLGNNDVVLAIGGGAILDIAGYAAAQVRGGLRIIRVPTTPTAMIDAAFADYAAIDAENVKDAFRVSSTPSAVIIDPTMAAGVLDSVWNAGIGEALRLALALDSTLFKKLQKLVERYSQRDVGALAEIAQAAYATRKKKGSTTLGLWSAMRLENMSSYRLPHGYAVPLGVCIETGYSVEKGYMKAEDREKAIAILTAVKALDCITNSQHLLGNAESLLFGIDAMKLASRGAPIMVPAGIGKMLEEKEVDRETYKKTLSTLLLLAQAN